jgi:hypothetical protein
LGIADPVELWPELLKSLPHSHVPEGRTLRGYLAGGADTTIEITLACDLNRTSDLEPQTSDSSLRLQQKPDFFFKH